MTFKNKLSFVVPCTVLAAMGLAGNGFAQIKIVGSLCNFDVYNNTGKDEDEFDIECDGLKKSDISGYWRNYNYGSPTAAEDPNGKFTTITYKNPSHNTADGGVEHFGIHTFGSGLNQASCKFQWKFNGTVTPPPPVVPPSIVPIMEFRYDSTTDTFTDYLTNKNTLPSQTVYVQRHELELERNVTLAELMPANIPNLVAQAGGTETELDLGLVAVGPNGTIGGESFANPSTNGDGSVVIYYDVFYYQNGVQKKLGTVLNAVNSTAAPEPASMAALGIGAVGMARARRRAKKA